MAPSWTPGQAAIRAKMHRSPRPGVRVARAEHPVDGAIRKSSPTRIEDKRLQPQGALRRHIPDSQGSPQALLLDEADWCQ
jgi:hypothetical protein